MREVEKLCDRVAIVSRGKIQAAGTLDELRERQWPAGSGRIVLSAGFVSSL